MMLQWVALISTGLVSVFLILLSVPLPAFLVRLVLKLVHNPTVAYVLKASLVIMGVIFVFGFVDMRRAEEKYTQLPANVDGAVKFAVLNNKFRTERNVYLYSLSLLVLLMVLRLRTVLSENTELKARLARVSSTTAATAAAAGTGASPHHHAE